MINQEQYEMMYIQIKDLNINLGRIGHNLKKLNELIEKEVSFAND